MKYTYAYKTSDGVRHEASMEAVSREAVFSSLRERGIKAIKVVAADGSKANGEIRGVSKRVVVGLVVVAVSAIALVMAWHFRNVPKFETFEMDMTRRQVIGDVALVDRGIRTGWGDVFPEEGERFFASFAIPGVEAGQRSTTIEELAAALKRTVPASKDDTIEVRQIKAMVEGMKQEARAYIAAGGTVKEYGKRLTERQDAEIAIYRRAEDEILKAKQTLSESEFAALWEKRNDELRNLGIRPVVYPE